MQVVRSRTALRAALAASPRPIGLVPTMGWLHAGHVSLVERARAESATVVMSIFVNPKQFGQAADFDKYPRNEARDLALGVAHALRDGHRHVHRRRRQHGCELGGLRERAQTHAARERGEQRAVANGSNG